MDFAEYKKLVGQLKVGKNLPDAIYLHESVFTGAAFHLFPVGPTDFILDIVAQEKVGTDRIGDVHRIELFLRLFFYVFK